MLNKQLNQLYLAVKGRGIIYQNQYIGAFTDGTAHRVITNEFKDKETLKIKIGIEIHLYEYMDIIEPVGLNETGLIKILQCPQCQCLEMDLVKNSDSEVNGIHCTKCPMGVMSSSFDVNQLITIWNNIVRRDT